MPELGVIAEIRTLNVDQLQSSAVYDFEFELARVLGRARKLTLRQIIVLRDVSRIRVYALPLQPLLRKTVRNFFDLAYTQGGDSFFKSHFIIKFTNRKSTKMRAKADLIADQIIARIEMDLRSGWSRYARFRPMVIAHTNRVFDDYGAL